MGSCTVMSTAARWGYACIALASIAHAKQPSSSCRYLPGDANWPSQAHWSSLNSTVGGGLVGTVPLGSPCHDPDYNGAECAALRVGWVYPQTQWVLLGVSTERTTYTKSTSFKSSSSIVAPYFQNQSCDPFTSESSPCLIGNYVDYAINVTSASDVAAGLAFAQENNIRLVIKNTGHE